MSLHNGLSKTESEYAIRIPKDVVLYAMILTKKIVVVLMSEKKTTLIHII